MEGTVDLSPTEAEENFFVYPEGTTESKMAIVLPTAVGPREILAVVEVYNAEGMDLSAETEGLSFSKSLNAMFCYIPASSRNEIVSFAHLIFPGVANKVSVSLVDWKNRKVIPLEEGAKLLSGYKYKTSTDSCAYQSRIDFINGGRWN